MHGMSELIYFQQKKNSDYVHETGIYTHTGIINRTKFHYLTLNVNFGLAPV